VLRYTLSLLVCFWGKVAVRLTVFVILMRQVIMGGGQDAREVTTTTTRERFEVRFFHSVFEDEIGRVKGHFGPINTVAFHPDGRR
jgi:translation initiation factor 3 subunit I